MASNAASLIDPGYLLSLFPLLLTYLPKTLELSALSLVAAFVIALLVVLIQLRKIPVLYPLSELYVLISRACPLMVQIYVVYFGVPLLLLYAQQQGAAVELRGIDPGTLAVIALSLHFGAYFSQVLRAALLSVDKGQMEAALTVGMGWLTGFRRIVLPQAFTYAFPPLCSQFLNIIKSTSILFLISVEELMAGGMLEAAQSYRYLEVYIAVAVIYWVICFVIERVVGYLSARSAVYLKG